MNGTHAATAPGDTVEKYVTRIEAHLLRFREGHDPMGHLFAIERLARAARTEWWDVERRPSRERLGP
jgi:hypothetical protein